MNIKDKLAVFLEEDRAHFMSLTDRARSTSFFLKKFILYKRAIKLAVRGSVGIYGSSEIENFFISVANKFNVELPQSYEEKSILHVVSECYGVGGHSKVVERWINYHAPGEKHSIYFTRMKMNKVNDVFFRCVKETRGEVYTGEKHFFDVGNALHLRRIAMKYERVILHTHMDDIIPLLAFGSEQFKRTVILYNHADHLFWIGANISHLICETRSWGMIFSKNYRGISENIVLGIPNNNNLNVRNGLEVRKYKKVKVITSIGMPHKFLDIPGEFSLFDYMTAILKSRDDVVFNIVGPTPSDYPEWLNLISQYGDRVKMHGKLIGDKYRRCINNSDIIIDSFPMSGGTALSDVVESGKATLSLCCVTGHLDYTYQTESYCATPKELIDKTHKLLDDAKYKEHLIYSSFEVFSKHQSLFLWQSKVKAAYKLADGNRKTGVKNTLQEMVVDFSLLDRFIYLFNAKPRVLYCHGKKVKVCSYFINGRRRFRISLFKLNMTI
ncbi:glycosyltransferase [Citrobacter freundii]|nr:glycosyltransferase [Citrobacter freundii]QLO04739.1 glycosyltransferase [Citrobacter freundii]